MPIICQRFFITLLGSSFFLSPSAFAAQISALVPAFPLPLTLYQDDALSLWAKLLHRIDMEPFNLIATLIFAGAILHTFFAAWFARLSHRIQEYHLRKLISPDSANKDKRELCASARFMHFLGEVEAIFGIWVIALFMAIFYFKSWDVAVNYVGYKINYTEPMFVVVIMAMSATRPILNFVENLLRRLAALGNGTPAAWWVTILTVGPVLGSFITEPAAMTICALLLSKQFYHLNPSNKLKYATLGLLFVNISVGGVLTNFAAPPVLMVARPWDWSTGYMMMNFGWKAVIGILLTTFFYYMVFRREMKKLAIRAAGHELEHSELTSEDSTTLVPFWITLVHILFMLWTILNAHYPPLFIGGFLFFLGFMQMTPEFQNRLEIMGALMVGFFLAGLVNHGGVQAWWISPVLSSLGEMSLFSTATLLTALNDNAAITYLSTLVEGFTEPLKYAVVAGAVAGGGLTVIANAPNPAGQSILKKFFPNNAVSPLYLLAAAIFPTLVMCCCFWFLR